MRKQIIYIVAILIVAGAFFAYFKARNKGDNNYILGLVARGNVIQEVSATGTVEPASKVQLQFKQAGEVEQVNVGVGDRVGIDQILIKLSTKQLQAQYEQARAGLDAAQAKLDQLLAGASSEDIKVYETKVSNAEKAVVNAKLGVLEAEANLSGAEQGLKDATSIAATNLSNAYEDAFIASGDAILAISNALNTNDEVLDDDDAKPTLGVLDTQALNEAELRRMTAKADFATAQSYYNLTSSNKSQHNIDAMVSSVKNALKSTASALARTNDVLYATLTSSTLTQSELDAYKSEIATARASINAAISNETAKAQLIESTRLAGQNSINRANSQVEIAKAGLNLARDRVVLAEGELESARNQLAKIKAGPQEEEISLYRAQIREQEAQIKYIEAQLENNMLKAPISGTVTEVNVKAGEVIQPGVSVISLIDNSGFQVEADVPEVDIAKVDTNDWTEIVLDAFPEEKIEGRVISIDPAQRVISGVVYYRVKIGFEKIPEFVKTGMTADVTIVTDWRENVLTIPQRAVIKKNGKKFVRIPEKEGYKETEVILGLKGIDGNVEVLSGLSEGETFITFIKE